MRQVLTVIGALVAGACGRSEATPIPTTPPPDCRLDHNFDADLKTLLTFALEHQDPAKKHTLKRASVNAVSADSDTVELFIVAEAQRSEVDSRGCLAYDIHDASTIGATSAFDYDGWSGGFVCSTGGNRRIICSRDVLLLILQHLDSYRNTMLFILAHELGHLDARTTGSVGSVPMGLDLRVTRRAKLLRLEGELCLDKRQDRYDSAVTQRQVEVDADTFAAQILTQFVTATLPVGVTEDRLVKAVDNELPAAYQLERELTAYNFDFDWTFGALTTELSRLSGQDAYAQYYLCPLLAMDKGRAAITQNGGIHPDDLSRVEVVRTVLAQTLETKFPNAKSLQAADWGGGQRHSDTVAVENYLAETMCARVREELRNEHPLKCTAKDALRLGAKSLLPMNTRGDALVQQCQKGCRCASDDCDDKAARCNLDCLVRK